MTRITKIACVLLLFIHTTLGFGKPAQKIPLKDLSNDSPVIIIAEVTNHQLEYLKEGESIDVDRDALWRKYKVIEILRNTTDIRVTNGEILSNSVH